MKSAPGRFFHLRMTAMQMTTATTMRAAMIKMLGEMYMV